MTLDRRTFLRRAALAGAAFALPASRARSALAAPGDAPVLVSIFLRGAADGLSLAVPVGERARYDALRPTIAVPDKDLLGLDGFFSLHPGLTNLHPLFTRGELAVVHAVGSPHDTRSHFEAQDYMERAAPGSKSGAGWLNATLSALNGGPGVLQGVALGPRPMALEGGAPSFAAGGGLDVVKSVGGRRRDALEAMFRAAKPLERRTARTAFEAVDLLATVDRQTQVTYPGSPFGTALQDAAALIKSGLPVRVITIDIGGWDHHEDLTPRMNGVARALGDGLAAFWEDLSPAARTRTVVMAMTEFGRTAAENGSRGTDHGRGSVMFVLGGAVRGGQVVAKWPGLKQGQLYQGRDLAVTIDFRDVFAEVLEGHMKLSPTQQAPIFPGRPVARARYPGLL